MNYHDITTDDMRNGDGLRVVLWVAGCSHKCIGCQNPITWDPDDGLPFDDLAKQELFEKLSRDYISGITFSGGDPLFDLNREIIRKLVYEIKSQFPEKTIWLYTGYNYEEIMDLDFISMMDVVVDGKFLCDLQDNSLHWRGSSNQRVIDVKKSITLGKVICLDGGKNEKNS